MFKKGVPLRVLHEEGTPYLFQERAFTALPVSHHHRNCFPILLRTV